MCSNSAPIIYLSHVFWQKKWGLNIDVNHRLLYKAQKQQTKKKDK